MSNGNGDKEASSDELAGLSEEERLLLGEVEEEKKKRLGQRNRGGNGRGGRGIPTTTNAPNLTAGADLVSDTERLRLRQYTVSLDGVLLLEASRRLGSNALDRRMDNQGMRRWLEVGLPPEYHAQLHDQRKYRFENDQQNGDIPGANKISTPVYLPPGYEKNKRNRNDPDHKPYSELTSGDVFFTGMPLLDEGSVVKYHQHFWVLDLFTPERASRDFTGFNCIPNHLLVWRLRFLLEERNLWQPLLNATSIDDLTFQERFDIVRAYTDAESELTEYFFDYGNVVEVYDNQFLPTAAAAVESPEKHTNKFYRWFRAQGRYSFWQKFERTSRKRNAARRNQNIPEAIAASEELADLVSTVVSPLTTSLTEEGEKDSEMVYGILTHWGTEDVRYAPADEVGDLRKSISAIQQSMMQHRTKAQLLLTPSHVKNIGDDWYPGSWDGVKKSDFVISLAGLSDEANAVLQQVLHGPYTEFDDDFVIDPGPMVGEWHNRRVVSIIDSFKTLLEMAAHVRKGGKITGENLHEKWLPGLIQHPNEKLVRGWWDANFDNGARPDGKRWPKGKLFAEYDPDHPEREFRAVSYHDWFYWQDPAWVMGLGNDQYVFRQIVEYINETFVDCGLDGVQVRIDTEDPNYFRHHDIAELITYSYDIEELKKRLRGIWAEAGRQRKVHTRPIYQKSLDGLPQELIARLDEPDADGKKFLQQLNKKSDRRVRIWAAFKSHGRKGGIRGFQISEAVRLVEDGYGTDNGLSKDKQQGRQADLIMLAWLSGQFDKAVYLTRQLKYFLLNDIDQIEQMKSISSAMGSGLHPKIALVVLKKLSESRLVDWSGGMMMKETPEEVRYVEDVFNDIEAEKLGKEAVKAIMEGKMHEELEITA